MNEDINQGSLGQTLAVVDENGGKKKKKKDKKKKEMVPDEKTFFAYTRTLLAWVRTSTSLLTFGFAIYKLLEQQAALPGEHPLLQVIDPRMVGIAMILSGFLGLLIAVVGYIQFSRKYHRTPAQIYLNPALLQSYVILALSFFVLIGAFIGGRH
jgi:putative membrane protein